MTETFTTYLLRQVDRQDPVGHLAFDARYDVDLPREGTLEEYHDHLRGAGAMDAAHDALDRAWREFEGSRP